MRHNEGFAVVEGILIIIVILVIGSVGYLGYHNFVAPKPAQTAATTTASTSAATPAPVKVESGADLDTAVTSLDAISLDDSDSAQLDSVTSSF